MSLRLVLALHVTTCQVRAKRQRLSAEPGHMVGCVDTQAEVARLAGTKVRPLEECYIHRCAACLLMFWFDEVRFEILSY